MKDEPAVTIGGISAAVAAILVLLVAFGIPLTADQQVAILGVIGPVGVIVVAIVIRRRVTPAANVISYLPKHADTTPVPGEAADKLP